MPRIRWSMRWVALALFAAVAAGAAAGCTGGKAASGQPGGAAGSAGPAKAELDTAAAVEKRIVGAAGGAIDVPMKDATARVVFPAEAIPGDADIAVTPYATAPAPADAKQLFKGFQLEQKGTGAGPKLAYPAWVVVAVKGDVPAGACLVRYTGTGVEPLPTQVSRTKNGAVLTAIVDHFSGVGGMDVGAGKAGSARNGFKDFDWVVYINDSQKHQTGPMRQTIKLTLRAVNKGGDIPGDYTGNATIKTTNDMDAMGGTAKAVFTGSSSDVRISVIAGTLAPLTGGGGDDGPLAPLVPGGDDDALAPLTPEPDWSGSGTIKMSAMNAAGTGTVRIGGYGGSRGLQNTSSVPVTLVMYGPQLSLTAALPVGEITFKGYIRGEGKK